MRSILVLGVLGLFTACVPNSPYRTGGVMAGCSFNPDACKTALIEQYLEFDLGFIEFTQRGNMFDRSRSETVLKHIERYAKSEDGVAVFLFVHGWKHGASADDTNVIAFREFLSRAAENPFVGARRVVGVYLGWRGGVTTVPGLKELSYWGRKSVAEEVGSGGATEVISRLQVALVERFRALDDAENRLYRNTFVVIGHSFGGAIVLSALHDVLLSELIAAQQLSNDESVADSTCRKVNRFADAILLINPAIEANRAILLREAASDCQFGEDQPQLMHVLSSEADTATRRYFPLGQRFNLTTTLSPKILRRQINGKSVSLSEHDLDITTVGNYEPFRTGYLFRDSDQAKWKTHPCDPPQHCGIKDPEMVANHIPLKTHDPLVFLQTDENFIQDHNDAFSCYVQAYITTVMFQNQSIDRGYAAEATQEDAVFANCQAKGFEFSECFNNQLYDYNCDLQN